MLYFQIEDMRLKNKLRCLCYALLEYITFLFLVQE